MEECNLRDGFLFIRCLKLASDKRQAALLDPGKTWCCNYLTISYNHCYHWILDLS